VPVCAAAAAAAPPVVLSFYAVCSRSLAGARRLKGKGRFAPSALCWQGVCRVWRGVGVMHGRDIARGDADEQEEGTRG